MEELIDYGKLNDLMFCHDYRGNLKIMMMNEMSYDNIPDNKGCPLSV